MRRGRFGAGVPASGVNDASVPHRPLDLAPTTGVVPLAVTPRQACHMLSVGLTRLYQLLNSNELDSFLLGKSRRITTASIQAFIARQLARNDCSSAQPGEH